MQALTSCLQTVQINISILISFGLKRSILVLKGNPALERAELKSVEPH